MTDANALTVRTYRYGTSPSQSGSLHLPETPRPPVVCLFHGGFWRVPHGRDQLEAVAADLAAHGYAVWNVGYRRVGEPGGGWPGTLDDAALALDHLASIAIGGIKLDLARIVVAGHSAGGQLALWVAARNRTARVRPAAVAALAALSDLAQADALGLGGGAVSALLGGSRDAQPDRYADASPVERLPLGVPQLVLHGGRDAAVPIDMSRSYAEAARAAGDAVDFVSLAEAGHMDFLDPGSTAFAAFRAWLDAVARE